MPPCPTFGSSVRTAAMAFGLSRLVIVACAWLGLRAWGIDAAEAARNWHPFASGWTLVDLALRYDAQWYLTIARDGYSGLLEGPYFDMRPNFMPMLPLLIRAVAATGASLVAAGLLVACAGSLVGLTCLHQVLARQSDAGTATTSVWVVALFPSSLFLSSVYSEGPLMAFTMGAWLAATNRRHALAGALAVGASLTRPVGAIVLLPLLIVAWRQRRSPREAVRAAAVLTLPSGAGLLGYLWWAHRTWGDALMLTGTQAIYRGATDWPWVAFARWWQEGPALHGYANSTIDAAIAAGALLAVLWLVRRGWFAEAAFAAVAVLVPLTSGLIAFSRMVLAAPVLAAGVAAISARAPSPQAASSRVRRAIAWLWWALSLVLLAWFSARFATWRWVA